MERGNTPSWRSSVERALQRTYAVLLTFYLLYFVKFCVLNVGRVDAVSGALIAIVVAVLLYLIVWSWATRCTTVELIPASVAVLAALALDARLDVAVGTGSDAGSAVTLLGVATLLTAAVVPDPKRFAVSIAGLTVLHLAGNFAGTGVEALVAGGEEALLLVPGSVAVFFIVTIVREVAERSDLAHEDAVRALLKEATMRERESALRAIQRVLHDDVIAALRSVEMTGVSTDTGQIVVTCDRAAVAVSQFSNLAAENSSSLEDLIRGYVLESPLDVEIFVDEQAIVEHLTSAAILGLVGASAEALRNVDRHSGQRSARIRLLSNGRGVAVEVIDRGRGFDVDRSAGFGIDSSIIGRMNDIGGTATIISKPGRTVVRLAWDPDATPQHVESVQVSEGGLAATYHATVEVTEGLRRPFLTIGIPFVAGNVAVATIYSFRSENPFRSIAMAGVVALLTVLTYRRLVRGPLSVRSVTAYSATIWAVVAVGLLSAPDGSLRGFESWIVGFASIPMAGIVFVLPWRWSVVLVAGLPSVNLGIAIVDPAVSPSGVATAILGPLLTVGSAALIGAKLRAVSRSAKEQEAARAEAEAESAKRIVWRQVQAAQLVSLDEEVTPFLRSVGRGGLDPHDESTRRVAAELSAQVRDNLSVPGLLDRDLRSAIRHARRRGCTVDIRASDLIDDREYPRALELMRVAVANGSGLNQLTFSLPTAGHDYARLVVVPADAQFGELLADTVSDMGGTIVGDEDAMVLTVPTSKSAGASLRASAELMTTALV